MKKTAREIYLVLAAELEWDLCAWCKYYEGYGSACEGDGGECKHPLEVITDHWNDFYSPLPPADCWGFRPKLAVSDIADIVGLVLAHAWNPDTVMWGEGDKLEVYGRKGKENIKP